MQMIRTFSLFIIALLEQYLSFGLGLDFGGEYQKASMLLPGRYFVMVEDSISKRKTPSSLSFCDATRYFEQQSLKKFSKQKCDSFRYLNRFFNEDDNQHSLNFQNQQENFRDQFSKTKDDFGNLFTMKAKNLPVLENYPRKVNEENEFQIRLEELYGMLLRNLKSNADRTTQVQFKNVVFTIPDNNVTIQQRKRIASSIIMSGMTPTAFVSENTAATVFYALNNPLNGVDANENILIINIGTLGVKINVMNIQNVKEDPSKEDSQVFPKVTKIYDQYFSDFNGNQLDYCFMNYTLNKHFNKDSENLLSDVDHTRFFKLFQSTRKAKEVLSINKTYHVKLDNFFENLPLSSKVVKEEFEKHCSQKLEQLREIFQKVKTKFKEQNITFSKLEVIGGVVRMPAIRDLIQQEFEMQPFSHINGDDGPCQGAALMAANYSAGIKTKKIQLSESPNYHVEYQIKQGDKDLIEKQTLFELGTPMGTKKGIQFQNLKDDLEVDMYVPEQNYHMNIKINGTDGLEEKMKDKNITDWIGVLNFELDLLGIPKLSHGMIYINETVTQKYNTTKRVLKKQNETEVKQNNNQDEQTETKVEDLKQDSDKDKIEATEENKESLDDQTLEEQQEQKNENLSNNSTTTNNSNSTDTTNTTNKTKEPEYEYVQVEEQRQITKSHKVKLNLAKTENISFLLQDKEEFEKSKQFLSDIENFEEERRNLLMKKNQLESYVYKLKDFVVSDDTNKFLNETEKDLFQKKSEEIDDYIFSPEIDQATFQNITDRIQEIDTLINPFKTRQQEHLNRDAMYSVTMMRFSNQTLAIEKIKKRKTWITEDKIKEVNAYLYQVRQNVTDLYNKQKEMELHLDPVFTVQVVQEYDRLLDSKVKDLRRIPKPKNETDSSKNKQPNLDDLSEMMKNMEKLKENMNDEKFKDIFKNLNNESNTNQEELKEKINKLKKEFQKFQTKNQENKQDQNEENTQQENQENTQDQNEENNQQSDKEQQEKLEEEIITDM